jgi:hypothetical protein
MACYRDSFTFYQKNRTLHSYHCGNLKSNMKITAFWNLFPCVLADVYGRFGRTCYFFTLTRVMYFPEDRGSTFRQKFAKHLSDHTVSHTNSVSSILGRHVPPKRSIPKNSLLCTFLCIVLCSLVLRH